ncbi:pilus assembly PilX N-terminal domain-containing protein [Anaerosinus sp.]|uniref:pilus assembly PilX N-terminal domain-containing protein n=1 Tax=Selenobaculum sp. TaxID=3074374 RepID=UPI0015A7FC2B
MTTLKEKQSGSTVIFGLLVLMVLSILLGGIFAFANMEVKAGVVARDASEAKYAAEAGITFLALEDKKAKMANWSWLRTLQDFRNGGVANESCQETYTVEIEKLVGENQYEPFIPVDNEQLPAGNYKIKSTGKVNSAKKKLVANLKVIDSGIPFDDLSKYVIYSGNDNVIYNLDIVNSQINGEIYNYNKGINDGVGWPFGTYNEFKEKYFNLSSSKVIAKDEIRTQYVKKNSTYVNKENNRVIDATQSTFVINNTIENQTLVIEGNLFIGESANIHNCRIIVDGIVSLSPLNSGRALVTKDCLIVAGKALSIMGAGGQNDIHGKWMSFSENGVPEGVSNSVLTGVLYAKGTFNIFSSTINYEKPSDSSDENGTGRSFVLSNKRFE